MINLSQIAEAAGVSMATVSRVLRDPKRQRTSGQRRVIEAATRLGYHFDAFPAAGATRQILFLSFSNVLSPEAFFSHGTYMNVVNGINRVISEQGYSLLVSDVGLDDVPPPSLLRGEVDGVIFHGRMSRAFYEKYVSALPFVGVQYFDPEYDCSWVKIDNANIAYQAVRHLAENGHRKICFVSDESECFHTMERRRGFAEAITHFGLEARPEWEICWQRPLVNGILPNSSSNEGFPERLIPIFKAPNRPTAIVGTDIYRALLAAATLREIGLEVPKDISVIGSRDSFFQNPTLMKPTSLIDRFDDVCTEAARLLLDTIENRRSENVTILLRPKFIAGDTVRNLNSNKTANKGS